MGRKKAIETDELITLIDEFFISECERDSSMLKIPAIGRYLRDKRGIEVQDPVIRKNTGVRTHIEKLKESNMETHLRRVAVFRSMDIDEFLKTNGTKDKLKKALTERDGYFREIANSAAHIFTDNRNLGQENTELRKRSKELEILVKAAEDAKSDTASAYRSLERENRALRDIIHTYVYPEIANELLKKDGLLKTTAGIADPVELERHILYADSDITPIKNSVLRGLFDKV